MDAYVILRSGFEELQEATARSWQIGDEASHPLSVFGGKAATE
jgi:hypothetical protein